MHKIIQTDCEKILKTVNIEKLRNKSILITGASGLVGIYLLSVLKLKQIEYNINIWCWVKNDIDDYLKDIFENCNIIKEDITNFRAFDNLPSFDYIIHSAGYGQPLKFLEDKIKTLQLNTGSTIKLFEKLKPSGSFLFLSSSEIYSGLDVDEINELQIGNTTTSHARACYIEGKRTGEAICHAFIEKKYNVKIARLSTAYGPGIKRHDKRVLSAIIEKGLTQDVINLMDNGSAVRVFCYIGDVAEMLLNILINGKDVTYNIAGIYSASILDIANIVGKKLNRVVSLPKSDSQGLAGNPKSVNININKYKQEFNKIDSDFITIDYGLEQTINWAKNILQTDI